VLQRCVELGERAREDEEHVPDERGHQRSSEVLEDIRDHQRSPEAIRGHQRRRRARAVCVGWQSEAISGNQGTRRVRRMAIRGN
jgi:hypothetical protein